MVQLISSPHAHDVSSVKRTMYTVCLAMTPATLYGLYLFGWPAINLFVLCLLTAVASEAICLKLAGHDLSETLDGSALITGWIIAMTLPPWAPWWTAVVGTAFAIVIGKQAYGGLGQNVFNPAMLARVGLLISFPVAMTTWVAADPITSATAPGFIDGLKITFELMPIPDGVTGATALGHVKTALTMNIGVTQSMPEAFDMGNAMLGSTRGSLGETSAVLIILGGVFLIWKKVISWHIPVMMIVSMAVISAIFNLINPDRFTPPMYNLLSGALMLGAFFIATDMVTSPTSKTGQMIYAIGISCVVFIIRTWGTFPEAVAFAVLFMNALTPIIDRYFRPRMFGYTLSGKPMTPAKESNDA